MELVVYNLNTIHHLFQYEIKPSHKEMHSSYWINFQYGLQTKTLTTQRIINFKLVGIFNPKKKWKIKHYTKRNLILNKSMELPESDSSEQITRIHTVQWLIPETKSLQINFTSRIILAQWSLYKKQAVYMTEIVFAVSMLFRKQENDVTGTSHEIW